MTSDYLEAERRPLTDDSQAVFVHDAAGQDVEIVLGPIHHYRVASVVAAL